MMRAIGTSEAGERCRAAGVAYERLKREAEATARRVAVETATAERERRHAAEMEAIDNAIAAAGLPRADRAITVSRILDATCRHFGLTMAAVISPARARALARPRQIVAYLAKKHTKLSLPQIARRLGNRDHTTILHAVRKIDELMAAGDKAIIASVDAIAASLTAGRPSSAADDTVPS